MLRPLQLLFVPLQFLFAFSLSVSNGMKRVNDVGDVLNGEYTGASRIEWTKEVAENSLFWFSLTFVIFLFSFFSKTKQVRTISTIGNLICMVMLIWSTLMFLSPTHISFDEVFPAWIIALFILMILHGLAFFFLRKSTLRSEAPLEDVLDQDFGE